MMKVFNRRNIKWLVLVCVLVVAAVLGTTIGIDFSARDKDNDISWIGIGEGKLITIGYPALASETPDYICDGVDDDVQFQAAVDALPGVGGELRVTAGTFDFSATVLRAIDNVTIEGTGRSTYFQNDGVTALFSAGVQANWVFRDIATDAGGVTLTNAVNYKLENVYLGSTDYNYVRTSTFVVAASDATDEEKAQSDYICDGTADNVQIQAALDALPAIGGRVLLSEGTFSIAATILVNGNYDALDGQGYGSLLLRANGSDVGIIKVSAQYNVISNIKIHGNKDAGDAPTLGNNLDITGASFLTLENLYIGYAPSFNLYANNGADKTVFWITNCILTSPRLHNAYLTYVSGAKIRGLVSSSAPANYDGIVMNNCVENILDSCFIDVNGRYGIYYNACQTMTLTNSYIGGSGATGVQMGGDYGGGTSHDYLIHGNIFNGNGALGVGHYELSFAPTTNLTAATVNDNNFIYWKPGWGAGRSEGAITLVGDCDDTLISNNQVTGFNTPINTAAYTGSGLVCKGNLGFIFPGEIRYASGSLTAGVANAICFAWNNPELQDILIKKVVVEVTTGGGTPGSHLDVGIADDATGTNRGTEFFDDLLLNTAQIDDAWVGGDGGTQTKWVFCQDSASAVDDWIVGQILDANAGSLVGEYYIEYVGR